MNSHRHASQYVFPERKSIPADRASCSLPEQKHRARLCFTKGVALLNRGRRDDAAECFAEAVTLAPSNTEYLLRLGQLEYECGRLSEAALCFGKLTRREPKHPSFWLTLGYIQFQLERYAEAVVPLSEAAILDPLSVDGMFYLAESLRKLERFEESLPFYQKLLEVGFDRPQAVYGYGLALLALGRFKQGWEAFEFRRLTRLGTWQLHVLEDWNGEATPNLSLLVYSEENLASDFLYASCLADLAEAVAACGPCRVECQPMLHPLFSRSFPQLQFVSPASCREIVQHDEFRHDDASHDVGETNRQVGRENRSSQPMRPVLKQVAFGTLPRFFRTTLQDFSRTAARYLKADPVLCEKWTAYWNSRSSSSAMRETPEKRPAPPRTADTRTVNTRDLARQRRTGRFDPLSGQSVTGQNVAAPPLNVGFLWLGSRTSEREAQRSIPPELFQSLLALRHTASRRPIRWASLQSGSAGDALRQLRARQNVEITHIPELFRSRSLDDLAAFVTTLDLVVTPPGYIANLAAALGVPTWCVLPRPVEWYWFLVSGSSDKESSLWFANMRLFRQKPSQPLSELFADIKVELQRFEPPAEHTV